MRIGVYGGSFNPPHVVHAMVASWLLWTDKVDEVWFVPVYQHAFDGIQEKKLAPYEYRVQWCKALAQQIDARIKVSEIESQLPTPSYTIDTLSALSRRFPEHQFCLCVGADVLPQLPQWKQWSKIERLFHPIIVGRVGYESPKGCVSFPPVSSSDIREHLSKGSVPSDLLTRSVMVQIQTDNPYLKEV